MSYGNMSSSTRRTAFARRYLPGLVRGCYCEALGMVAQYQKHMQENDANIKLVAEKLRTSIGVLCGKLKDNPNVAENAAKVASERQMLQILFGKALDELTTAKKLPCVMETVLSEQFRRKEIRDVVDREKTATPVSYTHLTLPTTPYV